MSVVSTDEVGRRSSLRRDSTADDQQSLATTLMSFSPRGHTVRFAESPAPPPLTAGPVDVHDDVVTWLPPGFAATDMQHQQQQATTAVTNGESVTAKVLSPPGKNQSTSVAV